MTRRTARFFIAALICLFTAAPVTLVNAEPSAVPSAGVRYFGIAPPVTDVDACWVPRRACEHYEQLVAEWLVEN